MPYRPPVGRDGSNDPRVALQGIGQRRVTDIGRGHRTGFVLLRREEIERRVMPGSTEYSPTVSICACWPFC